ncbi:HAD-IA family hydrolase [Acinetobacter bereziniae]|uniref:HAD-IA family hydrolase n=1 Tax=Acinetobacter bereziniae TaxID=106648 RepID=UPI0011176F81|nr:HAD-IA family hydrolase [Acinetobacter bereziniae]TNL46310.1 haloacid dehalogenase [Acinetobacter bereziniae]TNL56567.1 haloacid dehalogenase [Acinetobacter bereziniae]
MQKPIIFFDMDGTLLDLAFDDLIWNTKLPERHAQTHQCSLEQSYNTLNTFYQQHNHTLCWYSSKYWSEKVGVDVLKLQYEYKDKIATRPGCFELLEQLKAQGYRCWLLTNADCAGLQLKLENIDLSPYFEVMISSEEIGYSKEFVEFWEILQQKYPFDPQNACLVDDTTPVLKGAEKFGIQHLITITQPSSGRAARHVLELEYPAIHHLTELLPLLTKLNLKNKDVDVKTA